MKVWEVVMLKDTVSFGGVIKTGPGDCYTTWCVIY